jgi:hypothetical protein
MAANPRILVADVDLAWDGVLQHIPRGTIVDVPPGSALEAAYGGSDNLADLSPQDEAAASAGTLSGVSN